MFHTVKPLAAAALVLALVVGCQQEPADETGTTEETPATETTAADPAAARQAIDAGGDAWEAAALAGDAAALAALYAEDAVVLAPNSPKMTGRAAIEAGFAEFLAAMPFTAITITTDAVEVAGSGELAYAHGSYTSTNTMPDGSSFEDRGKWLSVHENRDGEWIFVADIWNSDQALPGMEAPATP